MQQSNNIKLLYDIACLDIGINDRNFKSAKDAFEQILLYMRSRQDELLEIEHTFLYCETIRLYTLAALSNAVDLAGADETLNSQKSPRVIKTEELFDYNKAKERCLIADEQFSDYLRARIERWNNGLMLTEEMFDSKMKQIGQSQKHVFLPLR